MGSDIAPPFDQVPDPGAAAAFSELKLRPRDFASYVVGSNIPPLLGPLNIEAVTAAYLEDADSEAVKTQFYLRNKPANDRLATAYRAAYRQDVGRLHEDVAKFEAIAEEGLGFLAVRAVELAREAGLRTVAAFVLYAVESGRTYGSLLIPKLTFDTVPLEYRERVVQMVKDVRDIGLDLADLPDITAPIQEVLNNSLTNRLFAFRAAATHLPDVEKSDHMVQAAVRNLTSDRGENRQQRRKREAQERRQGRRKR